MFEAIFVTLILGFLILGGLAEIYSLYKVGKRARKQREIGYIYDAKAKAAQEYLYCKFNIDRSLNAHHVRVMEVLECMSNRDFWIPKKTKSAEEWIDNLEVVCEVYKDVFAYYESEEYELLLKYKTGARVANYLYLPQMIKDDVERKCKVLGVEVY